MASELFIYIGQIMFYWQYFLLLLDVCEFSIFIVIGGHILQKLYWAHEIKGTNMVAVVAFIGVCFFYLLLFIVTHGDKMLHTLLVKRFRSLSGALIKLHTSMLGTFFVYTLAQSMPIFKKKSSQIFLGESCKLCVLHKNDFLCNTQSLQL